MNKVIASFIKVLILSVFALSSASAARTAKDFFAHEKRKKAAKTKRMKVADKATTAREKANRKKVGAADRYIAKRKKILKKKAKRETLFKKREDKRKARAEKKINRALKQAERKRKSNSKSPIPPDREYGIKVMPVKNPPGLKKSRRKVKDKESVF